MSRWIKVNDQMPKSFTTVIVAFSSHDMDVDIDWVDICADSGDLFFHNYGDKVNCWMPLPEPPQD